MSDESPKQSAKAAELTPEELQIKLEAVERERAEYLDGWKRAKADLINYKKEEAERFQGMVRFGNEAIVYDLLGTLDSFDIGLTVLKEDDPARKGMELIRSQLQDTLRRYGLETIGLSPGDAFDPARAEAVGEEPSTHPPGTVSSVVGRGYVLNGKVVRPARVKISKVIT